MLARQEVESFIERWARANEARDAERAADLYLRDPAPLVTFSDGERVRDWLDVRIRLERDLGRAVIERVHVHDLLVSPLDSDFHLVSFIYELSVRDMWGMTSTATRLATMTLVRTKDGLRIATAHFSVPRA